MRRHVLGIDVGGTRIRAGLVDDLGTIHARYLTEVHTERKPTAVLAEIERACRGVADEASVPWASIEGIGIGFAGTINGPAGVVLTSSNLPEWDHFPLRDRLSAELGVPVVIDNDSSLGALGEYTFGAGRNTRSMSYVTLSTGFGLGIIIDGRLYRGHSGTGGEIAHAPVEVNGPWCSCGKRGCLMSYASGVGISRMAWEAIDSGVPTTLRSVSRPDRKRISGQDILRCAQNGDTIASGIIETAGYYAGVGMALIVQILNPQRIVIGGGLTHMGDALMNPMMRGYREHTQPEVADSVEFVPWELGEDITILGAAALALDNSE